MNFLISDIQEKEVDGPKAPSFPQVKSTTTGFPEHKKRTRVSNFKQKRQGGNPEGDKTDIFTTASNKPISSPSQDAPRQQAPSSNKDVKPDEKRSIDRENNERLASMSPEEIEVARQELFNGLDPSVLEMLLKRANLDEPSKDSPFETESSSQNVTSNTQSAQDPPEIRIEDTSTQSNSGTSESKAVAQNQAESTGTDTNKRVRFATVADEEDEVKTASEKMSTSPPHTAPTAADNNSSPNLPQSDHTAPADAEAAEAPAPPKPHWPQPPQPADLDPHDPNFLQKLHEKYFPSLPADPSKLAWMAPVPTPNSPADYDSPYHPHQDSLPVSALRFDFRGLLLPPRIARAVPVTKGLHHHGEAPEAAGYTVRELARLCRSAVPGQRCVAYQTLGRVLYRLGRGEFGGVDDAVARGIWSDVEEGAVMRSLYEEAGTEEGRGHRSARAFAIEAIWLFEKGGWRERLRRGK
ncbi:hypothetical protein F5Y05DRAFT_344058 [Hypoxylon sp. FL0543]|nr:hypothetical protein F5Y05DRAFT_344058 [Hypoxylon sp. FL0543]